MDNLNNRALVCGAREAAAEQFGSLIPVELRAACASLSDFSQTSQNFDDAAAFPTAATHLNLMSNYTF